MDQSIPTNRPFVQQFIAWVVMDHLPGEEQEAASAVDDLAGRLNLNIVNRSFHRFEPAGITYTAILSQSHLIIHTWPESNHMRVDLVTCVHLDRSRVEQAVQEVFAPKEMKLEEILE